VRPLSTVAAYVSGRALSLAFDDSDDSRAAAGGRGSRTILRGLAQNRWDQVWGTAANAGPDARLLKWAAPQAIAAFCIRHAHRAKADRIVGPGNIYVAAAKKLLAGEVGIDFVAGPTEILIIAAEGRSAATLAADFARAGGNTMWTQTAVLLTTSRRLAHGRWRKKWSGQLANAADRGRGGAIDRAQFRHRAGAVDRGSAGNIQPLRAGNT